MTKFQQKDNEGRLIFQQYCNNNTSWCKYNKSAKDEFSSWDVSYTSGGTQVIGEIKMRNFASNTFNGWFLEDKKLKDLKVVRDEVINKQNDSTSTSTPTIQYINIFNDGNIIIWDITNIDSVTTTMSLKRTTMGNQFDIDKAIITLPTSDAMLCELYERIPIGNLNDDDDGLPF